MRIGLGVALAVVSACHYHRFDPVEELAFQAYPDARSAMAAVLAEAGPAKVYAVGEYHPTRLARNARAPVTWFGQLLDLVKARSRHLVLEAWLDDGCASKASLEAQVAQTTGRQGATDLDALMMKSAQQRIVAHGLAMTCIEQGALFDGRGGLDVFRLLELITTKLEATTLPLVESGRAVIVYGGALHNDLYPRWQLETLSYAVPLQAALGGGVVEIDLVVPEIIAPMTMVRSEAWFPLIGQSAPDRALVWKRGPHSFVVILPSQTREVARIAKPIEHA